jgi:hypothetical protein
LRRYLLFAAMTLLLVALVTAAGCGTTSSSNGSSQSTKTKVTEADLGVPIYPGATQVDNSSSGMPQGGPPGGQMPQGSTPSMPQNGMQPPSNGMQPPDSSAGSTPPGSTPQGSSQNNQQGSPPSRGAMNQTTFKTSDSVDKVIAWYKTKLADKQDFKQQTMTLPQGQSQTQSGTSAPTVFTFTSGSTTKMVMIRQDTSGGTLISIGDAPQGMPSSPNSGQTNQSSGTTI